MIVLTRGKCVGCGKFFIGIDLPCGEHVCGNCAKGHVGACLSYQHVSISPAHKTAEDK